MQLEVDVMEPGTGPQPNLPKPAGSIARFNYSLRASACGNKLLEAGAACKATLKTGALAPELDALLDAVGIHGKARCKVDIPWRCFEVLHAQWQRWCQGIIHLTFGRGMVVMSPLSVYLHNLLFPA